VTNRPPKRVVLCVDDNNEVLQSLRRQLRAGLDGAARVELSNNAERAMERLQALVETNRSGLVIVSDWLMPGLRGDQFVKQVREQFGDIPVVVLSGHITIEAKEALSAMPQVVEILPKPWAEGDLLQAVSTGLKAPSIRED
jgi:CheY-like chemotaxis protein